jgi:hypothetical protein
MSGQILVVSPDLPMPPGTNSNNPSNPKSTIKNLTMTANQADTDAQYDPPPKREGFQSEHIFNSYKSILYLVLTLILLLFVCKKISVYSVVLFGSAVALIYVERNVNRTV